MSQIVSSVWVTLEAQHSHLGSASLEEHWKFPVVSWGRDWKQRSKRLASVLQSYESNLPPLYSEVTKGKKKKKAWMNSLIALNQLF